MFARMIPSCLLVSLLSVWTHAATVNADFTSASHIPVTAATYTATGNDVTITLGHAPLAGAVLTVVNNTGLDFISGEFLNLAHGQTKTLSYAGETYDFLVNYYGGDGNDLVLQWATVDLYDTNGFNQTPTLIPTNQGALAGRKILSSSYSVAVCNDGRVITWGSNPFGQLGNGTNDYSQVPVLVDNTGVLAGKKVVAVSSRGNHVMALCSDGTVATWGRNIYGGLGNGTTTNSNIPVLVNFSPNFASKKVVRISAGEFHSLALCSDGTLLAWGYGDFGLMGNGDKITINTSVKQVSQTGVLSGKTVTQISAGGIHNLVLCSDGTMASWGSADLGVLGTGLESTMNLYSANPVIVKSTGFLAGKNVSRIFTGKNGTSMVICADNTLASWGRNSFGELANSSIGYAVEPTAVDRSTYLNGKIVSDILFTTDNSFFVCDDASVAFAGLDNNSFTFVPSPSFYSLFNFPSTSEIMELEETHLLVARAPSSNTNTI